ALRPSFLEFRALGVEPIAKIDRRGQLESVIAECTAYVAGASALLNVGLNVIVPELDGRVAGIGGDGDFFEQRYGTDRAGVQAVAEPGHQSSRWLEDME